MPSVNKSFNNTASQLNIKKEKRATVGEKTAAMQRLLEVTALALIDLLAFFALLVAAFLIRLHLLPYFIPHLPPGLSLYTLKQLLWFPFLAVFTFVFNGLYTRRCPWMQEAELLVKGTTFSFVITLVMLFLIKESAEISRLLILITWFNSLWLLPMVRFSWKKILKAAGVWQRDVLVLGSGKMVQKISSAIESEPGLGYKIVGVICSDNDRGSIRGEVPILGNPGDFDEILKKTGVRDVIIAEPDIHGSGLVKILAKLQQKVENVLFVPDIFGLPVLGVDTGYFFEQKTLVINFRNNLNNLFNKIIKRIFDIIAGLVIIIFSLPLLMILSIAIIINSPGPVFYIQERVGRRGNRFGCYKFRTMVPNAGAVLEEMLREKEHLASEWQKDFKLKNDPRITRVGSFLRKYSLDELPQLFNVLKGDMSLVGPRPVVTEEICRYGDFVEFYYSVRPGLSGLWQVSGRNDLDYETRVMLDTWYVRNWSLWLDIYILARTFRVVLKGSGAY